MSESEPNSDPVSLIIESEEEFTEDEIQDIVDSAGDSVFKQDVEDFEVRRSANSKMPTCFHVYLKTGIKDKEAMEIECRWFLQGEMKSRLEDPDSSFSIY